MLTVVILGVLSSAMMGIAIYLFAWTRPREIDEAGNPMLRYVFPPYLMSLCGAAFIGVGIYNWLEPRNHQHSGNLIFLTYIPAMVGFLSFGMAAYFFTFRATIVEATIQIRRWPLSMKILDRRALMEIEHKGNDVLLHFSNNRTFGVTQMHSGRDYFLATLSSQEIER